MNEDSGKGRNLFFRSPSQRGLFREYLHDAEFIDIDIEGKTGFGQILALD